jgi:hypothetical protein
LIITGLLTLLVVLTGILPPVRLVLVFAFLFLGPGLAFARLLPGEDIVTRITLSIALSLAIDAVVAMILLYAGAWSYQTALLIIVGITLLGSTLQLRPGRENNMAREKRE